MLGLALVVLTFQKQVSLPPRAMRLDALLKELSAATGTTYRASGPMAGRIVLTAGSARPAAALCNDLAAVTWGKWRQVGNEWLLDEDLEAVRKRERQRLASRIAQVTEQQSKMREGVRKSFDEAAAKALVLALETFDKAEKEKWKDQWTYREKVAQAAPSNAALRRIVAGIDPAEIAALENSRSVYSDQPTRLQRPLGKDAAKEIRQLERDQLTWTNVYLDNSLWKEAHRTTGWMSMDPRGYPEPIAPGTLRLLLKVQAYEHGQTQFSGYFIDKLGQRRQFGEVSILLRDGDAREDPQPTVDPKEPKILHTREAQALSNFRRGGAVDPSLKTLFLAPERSEPLDILMGYGLRKVAKTRNANLVAWLGDDAMNFSVEKGESAGEWLRDLWQMGYEVRPDSGTLLIRPRFNAVNIERPALGALLRLSNEKGYVPLDDFADYAAQTPSKSTFGAPLVQIALDAILPGAMQAARTEWKTLALWGSFSRAQRQALMRPGSVPWAAVPVALRDRLVDAVLNAGNNEISQTGGGSANVLETEPTELLANGFNFGDGIVGSGATYSGVFARSTDDNPWNGGFTSPWGLANAVVARERKPDAEPRDGLPKELPTGYLPGRIINFGFQIPLSSNLVWQKSGSYGEFDLRAKPMPISNLSEEFRKLFDQALERSRSQQ